MLWSDLGISSAVARFTPELLRIGPGAAGAFLRVAARTRLLVLALIVGLLLIARYRWSAMETVLPFRDASLLFIVMAVTLQSLARIHQYFLTGLFQRKTIGVILLVASGAQSALVILAVLLDTGELQESLERWPLRRSSSYHSPGLPQRAVGPLWRRTRAVLFHRIWSAMQDASA